MKLLLRFDLNLNFQHVYLVLKLVNFIRYFLKIKRLKHFKFPIYLLVANQQHHQLIFINFAQNLIIVLMMGVYILYILIFWLHGRKICQIPYCPSLSMNLQTKEFLRFMAFIFSFQFLLDYHSAFSKDMIIVKHYTS